MANNSRYSKANPSMCRPYKVNKTKSIHFDATATGAGFPPRACHHVVRVNSGLAACPFSSSFHHDDSAHDACASAVFVAHRPAGNTATVLPYLQKQLHTQLSDTQSNLAGKLDKVPSLLYCAVPGMAISALALYMLSRRQVHFFEYLGDEPRRVQYSSSRAHRRIPYLMATYGKCTSHLDRVDFVEHKARWFSKSSAHYHLNKCLLQDQVFNMRIGKIRCRSKVLEESGSLRIHGKSDARHGFLDWRVKARRAHSNRCWAKITTAPGERLSEDLVVYLDGMRWGKHISMATAGELLELTFQ
ncbi:hypothetical protein DFP72DRAFT_851968 [Ephemerocybe angulata]|uniref:Uncharacterized protein n=1 Tax=Ephemerocybe angulata TaxID=980116 RepID=A0A8H6HQD4_9AGAR|nr:hypothetical protein DFP72DRAFT_851968 [Tulosesus angulatus]